MLSPKFCLLQSAAQGECHLLLLQTTKDWKRPSGRSRTAWHGSAESANIGLFCLATSSRPAGRRRTSLRQLRSSTWLALDDDDVPVKPPVSGHHRQSPLRHITTSPSVPHPRRHSAAAAAAAADGELTGALATRLRKSSFDRCLDICRQLSSRYTSYRCRRF